MMTQLCFIYKYFMYEYTTAILVLWLALTALFLIDSIVFVNCTSQRNDTMFESFKC